jgi:hypothetical protein
MNKVLENEPNWSFQYLIFPQFYFILFLGFFLLKKL